MTILPANSWLSPSVLRAAIRASKKSSPPSHRNRSPGCSRPARSGRWIALRHAERCGSRHFLCNAAQSFGKEWETVCVSVLPRTKTTNPKQERKSYCEKQKKYPDLHRRRTLHPRDLSEFVAGCARTDVPWHAYGRHVLL